MHGQALLNEIEQKRDGALNAISTGTVGDWVQYKQALARYRAFLEVIDLINDTPEEKPNAGS